MLWLNFKVITTSSMPKHFLSSLTGITGRAVVIAFPRDPVIPVVGPVPMSVGSI
jgi:hypothetical protein